MPLDRVPRCLTNEIIRGGGQKELFELCDVDRGVPDTQLDEHVHDVLHEVLVDPTTLALLVDHRQQRVARLYLHDLEHQLVEDGDALAGQRLHGLQLDVIPQKR